MKRIGLLSDTHSYWDEKYIKHFDDCDQIWHAGDIGSLELVTKFEQFKPFVAVHGNIDDHKIRASFTETLRFELEGVDVLMTHIGGYPNRYAPKVDAVMKLNPPRLFICGHSHILKVIYDKKYNCLHINPGAAGKHGFHEKRTLVKFSIDAGNIFDLEIIELANR